MSDYLFKTMSVMFISQPDKFWKLSTALIVEYYKTKATQQC